MRIVLIILSIAALAFIGSILLIVVEKNGLSFKSNDGSETTIDATSLEILKSQWKTEEKLAALEAQLNALQWNTPKPVQTHSQWSSWEIEVIPISAQFLTKIMPTIELTQIENAGIFDLYTFDGQITYTTYSDPKFGLTVIASMTPYATFLRNFQSLNHDVYTINETSTFPFDGFYVNPPESDSSVRLVFSVEAQTLLLSFPKSRFDAFKALLIASE